MPVETIIYILIGCQAGLLGMLVMHLFKCRDTRVDIATIKRDVSQIAREVGDHNNGMRGTLHEHSQYLSRHELDIENLKRRENEH